MLDGLEGLIANQDVSRDGFGSEKLFELDGSSVEA